MINSVITPPPSLTEAAPQFFKKLTPFTFFSRGSLFHFIQSLAILRDCFVFDSQECINLTSTFRTIIELNKNPLFGVAVLVRFFLCVKNHVEVGVGI